MPGTTPRGYPYPVDTDPLDVAVDMQALAEAADTDAAALAARVAALEIQVAALVAAQEGP